MNKYYKNDRLCRIIGCFFFFANALQCGFYFLLNYLILTHEEDSFFIHDGLLALGFTACNEDNAPLNQSPSGSQTGPQLIQAPTNATCSDLTVGMTVYERPSSEHNGTVVTCYYGDFTTDAGTSGTVYWGVDSNDDIVRFAVIPGIDNYFEDYEDEATPEDLGDCLFECGKHCKNTLGCAICAIACFMKQSAIPGGDTFDVSNFDEIYRYDPTVSSNGTKVYPSSN
mgnify:CR=1 FL=1